MLNNSSGKNTTPDTNAGRVPIPGHAVGFVGSHITHTRERGEHAMSNPAVRKARDLLADALDPTEPNPWVKVSQAKGILDTELDESHDI